MKNIAHFTFMLTALLVISCTGEFNKKSVKNEETIVRIDDAAHSLKELIFKKVQNEPEINVEIALQCIIEQFESSSVDTSSNEKPIDIYVIYDTDVWGENDFEKTFQITLAHQAVENGILYEYRITFIYDPNEFPQIKEFDARHKRNSGNIEAFALTVQESPGFKKALNSNPSTIEIVKEEI